MEKVTTARIEPFVRPELAELQAKLHAAGMQKPTQHALVGGLILAANRSPIEAVKAVLETYFQREAEQGTGPGDEPNA
jgi:hypothetical protein